MFGRTGFFLSHELANSRLVGCMQKFSFFNLNQDFKIKGKLMFGCRDLRRHLQANKVAAAI